MRALAEACQADQLPAKIEVVIAPRVETPAVETAKTLGLRTSILSPDDLGYDDSLLEALKDCDWVCLAGYMKLLPTAVLRAFPNRVLNIHPALLPKFGGKGMYGVHVHAAVLDGDETESGCTVHYVTEKYDEGEIVLQLRCPVLPDDTPETLAKRVLELEHQAYPEALKVAMERAVGAV